MPDRPGTRSPSLVPLPSASNPVAYPREYQSTTNPEARVTNYNCRRSAQSWLASLEVKSRRTLNFARSFDGHHVVSAVRRPPVTPGETS